METLQQAIETAVARAIEASLGPGFTADIAPCNPEFGHYQCNSALRLGKQLKRNPREVAQAILGALGANEMFEKVEIAGPGFLNFTLSPAFLSRWAQEQLHDPMLGVPKPKKRERIIVEFSSPNIAKELHVGHLRSTIIGDCLARLFEFLGHDVLRLNHVGDWGTQFGMLIAYMKTHAPRVLRNEERADLESLMTWYKASKVRFDQDPDFKKRAQAEVVKLQAGEEESIDAWEMICEVSRRAFQQIYELLHVRLEERGESFYNPYLKDVIAELESKGLVTLSEGAKCVFLEGFEVPLMVQKSDGGFNYDTTDMAALRYRIETDRVQRIICVVDAGQSLHFQTVFAAARKAGWLDGRDVRLDHVGFGLVLGADGKKFKTRSGETEKLIDLLMEAIERAKAILIERLPVTPREEIEHLARVLGIGAVKYADLSCHRTKDYTFSYERMLKFDGNTAVFLLYAYVRISGIKRKTHANVAELISKYQIELGHPTEIALAVHVARFGEVLSAIAEELLPHRLTDYLFELAERFNAFFRDCRVEGSEEEKSRLALCELTARVLKQGLEILGLETVERM